MFGSSRKKAAVVPEIPILKPKLSAPSSSPSSGIAAPASSAPAVPSTDEAQRRTAVAIRLSAAFAQIVTVLVRSPLHKHLALADLEWLVFPPLLTGQFSVAEVKSKDGKSRFPAAVVLWASVSADVDKRLSENLNSPIRLRPDEWKSGEIVWLVEVLGDGRVIPGLLQQLAESAFKGKDAKMRARGDQGKVVVKSLRAAMAAQEGSAAQKYLQT